MLEWISDPAEETSSLHSHPTKRLRQILLHVFARNDGVEEAMLQQELGALKAWRKLLADGLLDDARSGKADQSVGFGDVQVAEHGEAGRNAAGSWVGHDGDIRNLCVVHPRKSSRHF